jgi:hypothetical protein
MDLEDLARVSRRRKRRQIKRQSRGRAWGIVRILLVGVFSASLLSVVAGVGAFAYG